MSRSLTPRSRDGHWSPTTDTDDPAAALAWARQQPAAAVPGVEEGR
ncbi:hypothetical protein [Streptomyces sp. NPDC093109]